NKALKRDSQRVAFSLCFYFISFQCNAVSWQLRCSPLNAALCFIEPQQNQYTNFNRKAWSDFSGFSS
ncbi:hypothetical protein, partial [Vibrio metschnikovii]|uniref:hypothetical protein n=1 Tax=Vibrio metschnikovii TaxID=28172 RepID=UPI001C938535